MPEPLTVIGAVSTAIGLVKHFINAIDLIVGASTANTPTADLWKKSLGELQMELINAKDQLDCVVAEIEPMRVKTGPGPDAYNRKRKEVDFDGRLLELVNQLKVSEEQFRNATDEFNQNGFFNWVLLETLGTRAREVLAPTQRHTRELNRTRRRVLNAYKAITRAFLDPSETHSGAQSPTPESLGGMPDRLALHFVSTDLFCYKMDAEDSLASGLLVCNSSRLTLHELRDQILGMGVHWVRGASWKPENLNSARLDVLENCQRVMLAQLVKGPFDEILQSSSFSIDRAVAMDGLYIVKEWISALVGGGGDVMIALSGKVNAGKSSLINAMIGRPLLPTAQVVCTAVPCRLQHDPNKGEPSLSIPWMEPYKSALDWIKTEGLSEQYGSSEEPEKRRVWAEFRKRDSEGLKVLLDIETNKCPALMEQTFGDRVASQMSFLNSIVRICRTFGNEIDMGHPYQWPILSVEFAGLKYYCHDLSARFSLLDLPGYNDKITLDTERFNLLMTRAARKADVIVPVIAAPTILQDSGTEQLIRKEWKTRITSVLITKRDLVNPRRLKPRAIAAMCNIPKKDECVLLCDTLQGMEAMQLQLRLDKIDRKYTDNPIPPDATAKTDHRLRPEITKVIAELMGEGALHRLNIKHTDKDYEDFTMDDWRDLVEICLSQSQLGETCDKFAETSIEKARKERLSRFIEEIEPILGNLVDSLELKLSLGRASLSELADIQCKTEDTLTKLQHNVNKWSSSITELRTERESKLEKALTDFEQVARENAEEAISRQLQLLTTDGETFVLGRTKDAEAFAEQCRKEVLDDLKKRVEDTMGDLVPLWDENKGTVLSLLKDVTAKIGEHPHIDKIIASTITEIDNVRRLNPEKIRIAVSGTSGEAAIETARKGIFTLPRSRSTRPVSDLMEPEAANYTGMLARITQIWTRFRPPRSTQSKHSADVSATEGPVLQSGTSGERPDEPVAPSSPEPENLAIAVRPASLAKNLEAWFQNFVPTKEKGMLSANTDSLSEGQGGGLGTKVKGTVRLTREVLYDQVLSASFHPVISRVKTEAQSCMTESLDEMAALAYRAVCDALKEYYKVAEKYMEAQKSEDAEKSRADTLECLVRWGNLVAAQGAIQEMDRSIKKSETCLTPSRPSSALLSPASARSQSPFPSSNSIFLSPI